MTEKPYELTKTVPRLSTDTPRAPWAPVSGGCSVDEESGTYSGIMRRTLPVTVSISAR
ncbi:hypothetical protein [Streptomyces sp. NPDC055400]